MQHRNDIDGLRAIAVLPVVLFHYHFLKWMPGGFVGVDIFFVISGYLITRIIYDGIAVGRYSIADFYYRRVRRIFPALFAMFAFCLAAAMLLSLPHDAGEVGHGVLASTFFVSNILFYLSSGYFDQASEINPLLHTWSLSVEEQFYLLFPLLVYAMRGMEHRMRLICLAIIAASSLAAAAWMLPYDRSAVFYLPHYRAWELLLGALLALGAVPAVKNPRLAEILAVAGLTMIAFSVHGYSSLTPFPGPAALLPTVGAALVIHTGATYRTAVARLLAWQPMRFIGQISYSLYLWHWPILVFYRYHALHEPQGLAERGILLALTFVAAAISWRFIEQPFRITRTSPQTARTLRRAGSAMLGMALFGMALGPANAQFWRYPDTVTQTLSYVDYPEKDMMRTGQCFLSANAGDFAHFDRQTCLGAPSDRPAALIFGDSHAAHLWYGLQQRFPSIHFMQATSSGCKPLPGQGLDATCRALVDDIVQHVIPARQPETILLAANWQDGDETALAETLDRLHAHTRELVVVGPIPIYDQPLPRLLAHAELQHDAMLVTRHRVSGRDSLDKALQAVAESHRARYVSLYDLLCQTDCTEWSAPGVPLQYDYGHLTREGSRLIADRLPTDLFTATSPRVASKMLP